MIFCPLNVQEMERFYEVQILIGIEWKYIVSCKTRIFVERNLQTVS